MLTLTSVMKLKNLNNKLNLVHNSFKIENRSTKILLLSLTKV